MKRKTFGCPKVLFEWDPKHMRLILNTRAENAFVYSSHLRRGITGEDYVKRLTSRKLTHHYIL